MSTQTFADPAVPGEDLHPYRALSKSAVLALVLGMLSALALASPLLLTIPLAAVAFAMSALASIRRYPNELSGRVAAKTGMIFGVAMFLLGCGLHTWIYATEVPDGYARISFAELQPVDEAPELPISPVAESLDGEKIFIKGYLYPDGQQRGIRRFVLIPDLGTCCFGGQPKLTDMVEVTLRDPLRVNFSRKKRKLAGTLKVDTRLKPVSGLGGVYYRLDADYVR